MKKKVLSALLCVSMVAAMLVGCGSTASEAPAAETQEAAATEEAPETVEETPADDNE